MKLRSRFLPCIAIVFAILSTGVQAALAQLPTASPAVRAAIDAYRQGRLADAERELRPLAPQDNEAAAWLAVVMLARNESMAEAIALLQRAAAAGNAEAQHNLGIQYATGQGVPINPARAAELFSRAAEQGHARAAVNLGTMYQQGRGVPLDPARARSWYERAANSGDPYGQFAFARLLESERNLAAAADLYRKAADQGHLGAALRYGRLLADGTGVGRNPQEALKRLRHAADNGLPEAALATGDQMAQMAARGELPRSAETARQIVDWYRRAAEAGVAVAQFKLGNACFAGTGIARDYVEAERWYRRAAQQNYAEAQYTLGIWLSGGIGGKTDAVEGYAWLGLAQRAGNSDAELVRQKAAEKMTAAQIAQADAIVARFAPRIERRVPDVDSLPLRPPQS